MKLVMVNITNVTMPGQSTTLVELISESVVLNDNDGYCQASRVSNV